ncbi:MAG: metallophosphoesterase [Phycisphaerales bacterium]|nr:MAG: metallophosphoesterase [Phycisphaerales bacterium]
MPQTTIDLLNRGITANHTDRCRRGNLVRLPEAGSLVVAGDIHGHRRNFERIAAYADLEHHPDRHLVLQEIIHGGPEDHAGGCLSYQLLFEAIHLKLAFPDQVHFVMGNHDTACICSSEVMKNGKEMNRAMSAALERQFQDATSDVALALRQFLFSQPLAVRCKNRVWVSHSLPGDRYVDSFDQSIFDRELKINDCERPGDVYTLTWGRRHSQDALDTLAGRFDVDLFVVGHQAQPRGWCQAGSNILILASDHNHGCLLEIDLTKSWTAAQLAERITPLASIS